MIEPINQRSKLNGVFSYFLSGWFALILTKNCCHLNRHKSVHYRQKWSSLFQLELLLVGRENCQDGGLKKALCDTFRNVNFKTRHQLLAALEDTIQLLKFSTLNPPLKNFCFSLPFEPVFDVQVFWILLTILRNLQTLLSHKSWTCFLWKSSQFWGLLWSFFPDQILANCSIIYSNLVCLFLYSFQAKLSFELLLDIFAFFSHSHLNLMMREDEWDCLAYWRQSHAVQWSTLACWMLQLHYTKLVPFSPCSLVNVLVF